MINEHNKLRSVIVRGWGGEPVKLSLERIENKRCYVVSEDSRHSLGLPVEDVFAFNEILFSTLKGAYEQGNHGLLIDLYRLISLDDLACNKYRDNVPSKHDQEHITNPECASRGS